MFQNRFSYVIGSLLIGIGLLAAGCNDTGPDSGSGVGTLEVRMTDDPASYDEVNVTVERVEVNREGSEDGWMTISEPQQTYNLLELSNGAYTVLGDTTLEEGTYSQIRLILAEEGHSVVVGGEEHSLKIPSGTQTGVKLNVNAQIEEDITYTLLLDFDASRSVVKLGNGNGQAPVDYLLKPVIQASNLAITGAVDGTVEPVDAEPVVYAIADSDTLATTYADTSNGYFNLIGLEEGTYTISINPTDEAYAITDTAGVEVTVGETNSLGTIAVDAAE